MARDRGTDTPAQRTEEERERAREERERRRLARAGIEQPTPVAPPLPPPSAAHPVAEDRPADKRPAEDRPVEDRPVEGLPVEDPLIGDPPAPESVHVHDDVPLYDPRPLTVPRRPLASPQGQAAVELTSRGSYLHRPHLHRPHLHRPHVPRRHGWPARIIALLALSIVLGSLAIGAVLLLRHSERPKIPPTPAVVKVVIPEGYTRAQIAALSHADGLRGSYLVASKRSAKLRPGRYGAPASTPNLEGFLFPATYEMYAGASASQLVSEQLTAFGRNFGGGEVHRAKALGVTPYQLLIVASIIEREAAIAHDRPLVAAVIYNRLRRDMSLGIDSTLRYALHDFTHPLTESELAGRSPYNTRIHKGLPPTPISNPGVAAIRAAARPASVSYLYYVAGADGCGEQVFSTSYVQFERNAAAYREALRKNGGRVPTCKKG